ncbi:MAG: methionyl-tRNA formyltransferase [Anaerolineaceae bacterium]|nr:methionyl-tRNA formyltransferase [Anaerolineaceae bacterium]
MTTRTVFMGSPDFALPTLKRLAEDKTFQLVGVITQPDRPAGRGRNLTPPPVKGMAQSLGLEVIQPPKLREPEPFAKLVSWQPDLIVVAAFGQILRQNVLDLPKFGCINVHASLLPRWRGAAPIQAAIAAGDSQSGVTIMKMDIGVDNGAVLAQKAIPILFDDNAETLSSRLADLGAQLLMQTLPDYLQGKIIPRAQNEALVTRAQMLKKEDGLLDFNLPADELERKTRAYEPWPGAYLIWQGNILKVHRAHTSIQSGSVPAKRAIIDGLPALGTSQGWLVLDEVQPAGKRIMSGDVFLNGVRQWD